jgi:hypothetical protein
MGTCGATILLDATRNAMSGRAGTGDAIALVLPSPISSARLFHACLVGH